ncbi:MAG: hypothetical protein IJS07_09050 [Bacteroidales bacterium]|nr:hypothetical protein [Bacteroidales bacterium]
MLEELKDNFRKLIALYEGQREENARLKGELQSREQEVESLKAKISDLRKQIENQKLTGAFLNGSESIADARAKVAGLIKEIDKCIALLES